MDDRFVLLLISLFCALISRSITLINISHVILDSYNNNKIYIDINYFLGWHTIIGLALLIIQFEIGTCLHKDMLV